MVLCGELVPDAQEGIICWTPPLRGFLSANPIPGALRICEQVCTRMKNFWEGLGFAPLWSCDLLSGWRAFWESILTDFTESSGFVG